MRILRGSTPRRDSAPRVLCVWISLRVCVCVSLFGGLGLGLCLCLCYSLCLCLCLCVCVCVCVCTHVRGEVVGGSGQLCKVVHYSWFLCPFLFSNL
jgi:hypothetical protein